MSSRPRPGPGNTDWRRSIVSPSPSPAPKPEAGKQMFVPKTRPFIRCREFNVFQTLDKVGQGTFGEVFKAKCKKTGDIVALKRVLMKSEQEGFPITALREIKILMKLNHINVLQVKEIVHTAASDQNNQQGSIYLVFDFMEHDLGGLLNRGVVFHASEIMCMAKQILKGLHYVHLAKIIHRDMKVANILMNNNGILKVADFGLARGTDKKNSKYTSIVCTRWYRPPEVLLGERNYTYAVDIWGVGCIVAELFEGRPILQGGKSNNDVENDLDQYLVICELCGTPSNEVWPGFDSLPGNGPDFRFMVPKTNHKSKIAERFGSKVRGLRPAVKFIESLLTLDPSKRPSAKEALQHDFFWGMGNEPAKQITPCEPEQMRKWKSSHEFKVQKMKEANRGFMPRPVPTTSASLMSAPGSHVNSHRKQQQQQQQRLKGAPTHQQQQPRHPSSSSLSSQQQQQQQGAPTNAQRQQQQPQQQQRQPQHQQQQQQQQQQHGNLRGNPPTHSRVPPPHQQQQQHQQQPNRHGHPHTSSSSHPQTQTQTQQQPQHQHQRHPKAPWEFAKPNQGSQAPLHTAQAPHQATHQQTQQQTQQSSHQSTQQSTQQTTQQPTHQQQLLPPSADTRQRGGGDQQQQQQQQQPPHHQQQQQQRSRPSVWAKPPDTTQPRPAAKRSVWASSGLPTSNQAPMWAHDAQLTRNNHGSAEKRKRLAPDDWDNSNNPTTTTNNTNTNTNTNFNNNNAPRAQWQLDQDKRKRTDERPPHGHPRH